MVGEGGHVARAALADLLHRRRPPAPIGLAAYGAVSLLAGFALIAASLAIQWHVLGGLITALATGSATDILIGCYLVIPLALAMLASLAGLIRQTAAAPPDDLAGPPESPGNRRAAGPTGRAATRTLAVNPLSL